MTKTKLEKKVNCIVSVAEFNNIDKVWFDHKTANEILKELRNLNEEVKKQTERADNNFDVASLFEREGDEWRRLAIALTEENEQLTKAVEGQSSIIILYDALFKAEAKKNSMANVRIV